MRKSFIRLATVVGVSAMLSINTFAATFTDVTSAHWAYSHIEYMEEMRYMMKTSKGEFLPNEKVSYFDLAIILAKAAGYQDELVNQNMDETLKQSIRDNFNKQIPKIQTYSSRYTSWEHAANEEIAYLLGTGVLGDLDLSRFVIKTATGIEVENIVTKQDLSAMLVRFIGRENTAIDTYTTTGFNDEADIRESNRPHVAYLKQYGIVSGDSSGNFGANEQLTRAQVATMTHRAIIHKEQMVPPQVEEEQVPEVPETPEVENTDAPITVEAVLNKVVPKGDGEYYVLLEMNGGTTFYTATASVDVRNQEGDKLEISTLESDVEVKAVVGEQDNTDVVFQIIVQGNSIVEEDEEQQEDVVEREIYTGEIDRIGRNEDLTVYTSKGAVTYTLGDHAEITYERGEIAFDTLNVGDIVEIVVQDSKIVEIEVLERVKEEPIVVEAEFVSYTHKASHYEIVVLEDGLEVEYDVDTDATIKRNGYYADWNDLHIGDDVIFTFEDDTVVGIEAESKELELEGQLHSVLLALNPEITVLTEDGEVTVAVTSDTEIYNTQSREDITLRELMIGAEVEVITESKEALSIIAKDVPDTITYKGMIVEVGSGATYIEVLVDYDELTGQTKVMKTVNVPSGVEITIDDEQSYRKKLESGMDVLIKYSYGEMMYPLSIEVLD